MFAVMYDDGKKKNDFCVFTLTILSISQTFYAAKSAYYSLRQLNYSTSKPASCFDKIIWIFVESSYNMTTLVTIFSFIAFFESESYDIRLWSLQRRSIDRLMGFFLPMQCVLIVDIAVSGMPVKLGHFIYPLLCLLGYTFYGFCMTARSSQRYSKLIVAHMLLLYCANCFPVQFFLCFIDCIFTRKKRNET